MTYHIPNERKPVLRQKFGIWWCSDPTTCGTGLTQREAYKDWKQRRQLIERMRSNARQVTGFGVIRERERHGGYYNEHGST